MIRMFEPTVSETAVQRVSDCLRSGWIGEGKGVRAFEEAFSRKFGLPISLALNSGTAALHLAMLGAGVGPGDEVITTAHTFVATAMTVLQVGAVPVFADLMPGGSNIDPADVERRIGPQTKAIVIVHYGGYPCEMDEFRSIAASRGVALIEDAAHALGATYRSEPVGAFGDFAAFSFQAIKQLTTGDGGMLVCADENRHREALKRRWFGIDRERRVPSELGEAEWDIREIGFKYHMNDIAASMGLAHLETFDAAQQKRRELNVRYRRELANVGGLRLLEERSDREGACWLFTVLVENRLDFVRAMHSRGIEAAAWHRRIDAHSVFGGRRTDLPNLEAYDEAQVSLPLRDTLGDDEVERILGAVREGW
ncbi:MAG: DegT/DnrJ/EryC1/StrS family aminotransferase [Coriobacteriia bacterium]